jgi:hypothetical protein
VSVEVKLDFSAKAVHQACSYCRFSHRVWVACAVSSEATDAGLELRSADPGLFDYALADAAQWHRQKSLHDIADMAAVSNDSD